MIDNHLTKAEISFKILFVVVFTCQVPFSMTHMIDVVVEELESPDSENGSVGDAVPYRHFTLVMKSLKQPSTTFLLIDSIEEKVRKTWIISLSANGRANFHHPPVNDMPEC